MKRLASLSTLTSHASAVAISTALLYTTSAAAEMGLEPGAPQSSNLPGGVSPGVESQSKDDWRFHFHGFLSMPAWMGIGKRAADSADGGESFEEGDVTLHAPPVVPGEAGSFADTNVLQRPWTQLNFSYGTSEVMATVIVAAKTASSAQGYFNPPDHIGIQDAFLTLKVDDTETRKLTVHAGAFSSRYGTMGEYDEGQYSVPVAGRIEGAGVLGAGRWAVANGLHVLAEVGAAGNIDKPVLGTIPEGWNGFVDANIGSTFAGHAHLGLAHNDLINIGTHLMHSFSSDDQAGVQEQPDAKLTVIAADGRLTMGPWGHLFFGMSHAIAKDIISLGGVLHYLETAHGPDLIRNYLGVESGGNGSLTTLAAQYDFSLASALLAPEPFSGNAPDLRLSLFGMMVSTNPDVDGVVTRTPPVNRIGICSDSCLKYGGELTYKPLSWFAMAVRGDQVDQFLYRSGDDNAGPFGAESFTIVSPRLIFSSDWNSQDQITLQYSNYSYGSRVAVRNPGYDPRDLTYTAADQHTLSLHAAMWW
jgi:hypothetical protein